MTILLIVGAFLVIGWIIKTLTFALSTIVVIAVLGAGLYLYARYKAG